jgi:excinuclease ABC subunit B
MEYNRTHNIVPKTIQKPVRSEEIDLGKKKKVPKSALPNLIITLESQMKTAAQRLDFEEAIRLRDQIAALRKRWIFNKELLDGNIPVLSSLLSSLHH